jgi:hypothetical protein
VQTLGLSNSTPRTESRLKSLFWPSIQTGNDVDYLGMQGYWVCAIVAVSVWITSGIAGHAITGFFFFLFFYLGGVGVREHSRYAAALVFVMYAFDTVTSPGIVKVFLAALLLSNLRATWIASRWKPDSNEAAMPIRMTETWGDRFADRLPQWLWPKVRIVYYVLSLCLLLLAVAGTAIMILRRHP